MIKGNTIYIPDCCEDCQFHDRLEILRTSEEVIDDLRGCRLYEKKFSIDELFDEDHHHQLRRCKGIPCQS
mgnify:CR=1 FL=1